MRRLVTALATTLVLATAGHAAPAAATDPGTTYAPVDRPGPKLRPSAAQLAAALTCKGDFNNGKEPVLLVPGSAFNYQTQYSWSWAAALTRAHIPWCAVSPPYSQLGDVALAGEYDVYAIRHTYHLAGNRKIAILGHSQGGAQPRWALRFWPDTRKMVADMVGVAPANNGGKTVALFGDTCSVVALTTTGLCPPAIWQMEPNSNFIAALNSRQQTFPGIDYSVIYSTNDGLVQPADTSLVPAPGTNYRRASIQSICPLQIATHLQDGSTDPVTWAMITDAITHPGPLDPTRVNRQICGSLLISGINPLTAAIKAAGAAVQIANAVAGAPKTTHETALPAYVYAN